jgi:NADH-quinone oxidoreductase subunit J
MSVTDVLVTALGAIAVGAALLVVTTRHVVRAGLWLVVALGALAGVYLVLTAELVAWVQMLIYVGAVVVLLLFAMMLTRAPIGPSADLERPRWPALLVGVGAGGALAALLVQAYRWTQVDLPVPGTAERVGAELFREWVLPFEVLSVLLLAALVGAIIVSNPTTKPAGTSPPVRPAPDDGEAAAPSTPARNTPPVGPAPDNEEAAAPSTPARNTNLGRY